MVFVLPCRRCAECAPDRGIAATVYRSGPGATRQCRARADRRAFRRLGSGAGGRQRARPLHPPQAAPLRGGEQRPCPGSR